jgi:ATP-dependent exoDNAse (exonuclease V) alpha subunit
VAHNAGRSAILLADKNADMHEMNGLVHERLRDRLGEERSYGTAFGERTFANGDLLIGREGAYGGVNGDRYTLAAHRDDGRMELVRQRDSATVLWDAHEHPAIDLGYAMTSYRSQSKTVDEVLVLASDGRRGNYVDVTRARDTVTVAYGRDQIRDFGS